MIFFSLHSESVLLRVGLADLAVEVLAASAVVLAASAEVVAASAEVVDIPVVVLQAST